ncbi:MAG: PilZ domain-containing protein [Deltaproteobacteria bacterium]|nr:PilZ domain-containing protein [Deltaproteobacteria bacterium]
MKAFHSPCAITKMTPAEQRQHRRFRVPKTTFVALWPEFFRVGQVADISMGGLAFRHLTSEDPPNGSLELDLFLAGRSFYLYKLPLEMIWNFEPVKANSSNAPNVRQCGLQFGGLTPSQAAQLEYFIRNYTATRAQA